jgi:tRNA A-37 threonylcarbamoyl transferase component Bud32
MATRKAPLPMLPLTPTKLGRYEVTDEIGKGAMGVVYLARDPLIGRLVALKTFRIGYSVKDQELEQFRIRFMREAQSAGILTHPHIVTIHDVVEASEEGLAFIAMEYVRGTNLKLLLQGGQPMSLATALDIVSQVGDALDYAHANRVIHRDVKPANILITTENRVKITDFGIARLESSNLTQEGQLLGTPNYMAPEQIQGKEVDHRADLFSLGVVLYEMLTRHKPFQGENLTVVSHRIVYDHFTPPQEYVRDLTPGIDRILSRALEKDPARRYQRAKEMVDDLRRVVTELAGRPDALNETLASAPLLPPAADGTGTGSGTGSRGAATGSVGGSGTGSQLGSGTSGAVGAAAVPADLADTVATGAKSRLSPRRLLLVGGIAAALMVLSWGGARLWTGRAGTAGPQRDAHEDGTRVQALDWVRQGKLAESQGNWPAAVFYFHKAEQLDPKGKGIKRLREGAERNVAQASSQQSDQASNRESAIVFALNNARHALEVRSYDAAVIAATMVVQMDPLNTEARQILVKAQDGATRKAARQRQAATQARLPNTSDTAPLAPIPSVSQPANRVTTPAPAETGMATLHIHVRADMEGSVIVSDGHQDLYRKNFERGGFFHRNKPEDFTVDLTKEIPAATSELRVIVAPAGKKADVQTISTGMRGGSAHRLEITLSKEGKATVQFN